MSALLLWQFFSVTVSSDAKAWRQWGHLSCSLTGTIKPPHSDLLDPHGGFFFWEAGNHAVFMTVAVDSASLNINTVAVLDWCDECRRTGMWRRILLHVFAHSLYAWGKVAPARKPCCFNANVIPAPRFLHRHGTILWAPSRKWRS